MSKNPTPQPTEVQDAAGDLAAFLKEAKASGTGSTEESPMPRRKPENPCFFDGSWRVVCVCVCVCVVFFPKDKRTEQTHMDANMYSCWLGGIFYFILYIFVWQAT